MSALFDFSFRTGPGGPRREPEDPVQVLVLADLAGAPRDVLAERRVQRVDVDSFDAVMQRIGPRVEIDAFGERVQLGFRELDDFHPDRLLKAVPRLQAIVALRRRLLDPATSAAAVAELRGPLRQEAPPPEPGGEAASLERLLGKRPVGLQPSPDAGLQAFLQRIVAPHLAPSRDPRAAELVVALEQEASSLLRAVLHAPAFQSVAASWRQLHQLVNEPAFDDGTAELYLLDARKAELAADLRLLGPDLTSSALHRVLVARGSSGPGWSLIACGHGFENSEEDLHTLAALGALGQAAGAPVLAEARGFAAGDPPGEQVVEAVWDRWRALQRSPQARWLGLLQPRLLCRLPYGKNSDPIETLPFEEQPVAPEHAGYLWGSPALDGARLFVQSCAAGEDVLQLDDQPSYVWPFDQRWNKVLCTEWLLSESTAESLGRLGLMMFQGHAAKASVRLGAFRSLATPAARLPCPWD